jgi:isoquinoline 1-oxidoreductase alpha subunit
LSAGAGPAILARPVVLGPAAARRHAPSILHPTETASPPAMPSYTLTLNARRHTVEVEADTPLLWVIRDALGLTGTKYGCGEGVCGACTIHESGRAVRACLVPIAEAAGREFTTIEGLGERGLHPCQQAWLDVDVAQCGFCQPGMIMAAAALLNQHPAPTDAQIDAAMSDLVCRCGTYNRMREAIHRAARAGTRR